MPKASNGSKAVSPSGENEISVSLSGKSQTSGNRGSCLGEEGLTVLKIYLVGAINVLKEGDEQGRLHLPGVIEDGISDVMNAGYLAAADGLVTLPLNPANHTLNTGL